MARVDFYILPDGDESRRRMFVARLVEKAWRLGHDILIHAPDNAHADALDELLWTFDQGSFLPHERAEDVDPRQPPCPVILARRLDDVPGRQVLVNEAPDVPAACDRFDRIAEVVNQDETVRRAGRQRYAWYRKQGLEMHHHEIT